MEGQLFYMIGASGAGKNRIMREARRQIDGQYPVVFAHRYITRETTAGGENHIYLSRNEFKMRLSYDFFVMNWESYGNYYGIGHEVDYWLMQGVDVVVNGSREYLNSALEKYPDMRIVHIEADYDSLKKRLLERNRENRKEVEMRLERAKMFNPCHPNIICIHNNDHDIEKSVESFTEVILNKDKK